jgi:D-threo-aldose 1-dehydrogenase
VLLLAGRYTLLDQGALAELLPRCVRRAVRVVVGGPFNSGILAAGTGGAGARRFDYAPASAAVMARTAAIEAVCAAHGVPL